MRVLEKSNTFSIVVFIFRSGGVETYGGKAKRKSVASMANLGVAKEFYSIILDYEDDRSCTHVI